MNQHQRLLKAACVVALALGFANAILLAQAPSASTYHESLPNFHQVDHNLYRSAQPKAAGFSLLARLGVKSIVNLREDDAAARHEASLAGAAGLKYFNLPLDRTGRPRDEQVEKILSLINDPANQPVLVHCRLGADRTGTVIALYRITHDGWTSKRATDEAEHFGMHFWESGMKNYIRDYYKRYQAKVR
jgi:tyrosine-protein phosphatase SIW14